jgi:Mg2+ and Co2+ transporter CorA
MPELRWRYGYSLALSGMVATGVVVYLVVKQRRSL